MITKHTPGTWKAEGWENVTINAHDPNHPHGFVTIVACPGGSNMTTLGEMQANAALIAAAPDLLAALEAARAESRRIVHPDRVDDRLYRIDRILTAAIAKATGIKE